MPRFPTAGLRKESEVRRVMNKTKFGGDAGERRSEPLCADLSGHLPAENANGIRLFKA